MQTTSLLTITGTGLILNSCKGGGNILSFNSIKQFCLGHTNNKGSYAVYVQHFSVHNQLFKFQ